MKLSSICCLTIFSTLIVKSEFFSDVDPDSYLLIQVIPGKSTSNTQKSLPKKKKGYEKLHGNVGYEINSSKQENSLPPLSNDDSLPAEIKEEQSKKTPKTPVKKGKGYRQGNIGYAPFKTVDVETEDELYNYLDYNEKMSLKSPRSNGEQLEFNKDLIDNDVKEAKQNPLNEISSPVDVKQMDETMSKLDKVVEEYKQQKDKLKQSKNRSSSPGILAMASKFLPIVQQALSFLGKINIDGSGKGSSAKGGKNEAGGRLTQGLGGMGASKSRGDEGKIRGSGGGGYSEEEDGSGEDGSGGDEDGGEEWRRW